MSFWSSLSLEASRVSNLESGKVTIICCESRAMLYRQRGEVSVSGPEAWESFRLLTEDLMSSIKYHRVTVVTIRQRSEAPGPEKG